MGKRDIQTQPTLENLFVFLSPYLRNTEPISLIFAQGRVKLIVLRLAQTSQILKCNSSSLEILDYESTFGPIRLDRGSDVQFKAYTHTPNLHEKANN